MNYIGTTEAAQKWGIGLRRVQYFCSHGMIPGARHMGKQWVIPANAERPLDGRTRSGRAQEAESYHFPVFIYSPCYADPSTLDENEQRLLQAQILRLEGKYAKSIEVCRSILEGPISPYLAAGVHLTIGFDAMLLGIISEYRHSLAELKQIIDTTTQYTEDIRLMRAFLLSHSNCNCTQLFAIKPEKLSAEAMVYYKYCLLSAFIPTGEADGKIAFRYFNTDLPQIERDGITPAVFSFHCLLGSINNPENSGQEREAHMRAAVTLAVKNHWVAHLCKYYNAASGLIEKCLAAHGDTYVTKLRRAFAITMKGWQTVHAAEVGNNELQRFTSEQIELLLLVSYKYSNKTIAAVKGFSNAESDRALAELCAIAGVSTKAELVEYARNIISAS